MSRKKQNQVTWNMIERSLRYPWRFQKPYKYTKTASSFSTHLAAHMKTAIVIATNAEKNILCSIRGGWWNSKSKKLPQNNNFKIHISQKINRSSHPNVYFKKCALKNFAKFSGKHQRLSLCFNKVAGLRPTTLLA